MHLISVKVSNLFRMLRRFRFLTNLWIWAFIALSRIVMVIYMALEVFRAVIPRAGANEHAIRKPFRPIVTVWSTTIRSVVIVTVRAFGGRSYVDIDLSLHFRSGHREADSSHRNYRKKFPSLHKSSSVVVRALIYLLLGYSLGEKKNKR
jgi:hypothetical protein